MTSLEPLWAIQIFIWNPIFHQETSKISFKYHLKRYSVTRPRTACHSKQYRICFTQGTLLIDAISIIPHIVRLTPVRNAGFHCGNCIRLSYLPKGLRHGNVWYIWIGLPDKGARDIVGVQSLSSNPDLVGVEIYAEAGRKRLYKRVGLQHVLISRFIGLSSFIFTGFIGMFN